MKFLVLAYGEEKDWKTLSKDKQDELLAQDERLRARGDLVEPSTIVRAWDGQSETRSGPFARGELPMVGFGASAITSVASLSKIRLAGQGLRAGEMSA